MLMNNRYLRRYCKECGNVTKIDAIRKITVPNNHTAIVLLFSAAIFLTLELVKLSKLR